MNDDLPYLPFQSESDTSREAAAALADDVVVSLREQVYHCIRESVDGLTDDDVQRRLDLPGNTERPRRIELVRAGRIVDSGERRITRSGRRATVWSVPHG